MRLQGFLIFLVLFVAIREYQCNDKESTPKPKVDWDWDGYYKPEDDNKNDDKSYYNNDKKSYDNDKGGYSKGKKSYDNDKDDYSEGKKSSYNDKDDYSEGKKSSYNDKDDYSKGKKSSYNDKDDNSKGKKSSYNDKDDYSEGKKSSYNDKDDYSKGKKSYNDKDDYSYDKKQSYNDDDNNDNDYKPSKYGSSGRRSPKDVGYMNIYVREPSKDGKRKKGKRLRMPTARYERDDFPFRGPFINFLPWLPIFADRRTKQTIIFSPIGGCYIVPPVINFYGDMFSVAELIASGYASLVSSGIPPPPAVDVAPLVRPGPVAGPGIPPLDPSTGGFKGGVRTEFRKLDPPKYTKEYQEGNYNRGEQYVQPGNY